MVGTNFCTTKNKILNAVEMICTLEILEQEQLTKLIESKINEIN